MNHTLKTRIQSAFLTVLCLSVQLCMVNAASINAPRIGITKIVSHPSLNKIEQGVIDKIKTHFPNAKITTTDAQGNITTAAQIAQRYASEGFDLVIPITTPSAQTMYASLRQSSTRILFAAVTDPIGANLVDSLTETPTRMTGVIDQPPVSQTLSLMRKVIPNLKSIGVVFNAGEANSEFQIGIFRDAAEKLGISVQEVPVAKSSDIQLATESLIESVDAFFLPNDNLVISSLESILKVTNSRHKLVFVSDPESIVRGAFGAVTFDQYKIGTKTGELAIKILEGEPMPPLTLMENPETFINEGMAEKLGLKNLLTQPSENEETA